VLIVGHLREHKLSPEVQHWGVRAICNLAWDPVVARERLATTDGLLQAVAEAFALGCPSGKDPQYRFPKLVEQASETMARMTMALAEKEMEDKAVEALVLASVGPSAGEPVQQELLKLVDNLIENEVLNHLGECLPRCVVSVLNKSREFEAAQALSCLGLAFTLAGKAGSTQEALIRVGAIQATVDLMRTHMVSDEVQNSGVQALSKLVGTSWKGLGVFAETDGLAVIADAMAKHSTVEIMQCRGIRALCSAIDWPEEIRKAAKFNPEQAIALTKSAMSTHGESETVQQAGLEALKKYVDKDKQYGPWVKKDGCEGLIKAMMMRHLRSQKIQTWGRAVLDGIGVDRAWMPKGAVPPAPIEAPADIDSGCVLS